MSDEEGALVLPVLTGQEADDAFLSAALSEAESVECVLVVDRAGQDAGFAPGEISKGREVLKQVCRKVKAKRIACRDELEWGSPKTVIANLAQRTGAKHVAMVRQQGAAFDALVRALRSQGLSVNTLPLPEEPQD